MGETKQEGCEYYRQYVGNLRAQAFSLLGGKCARCGSKVNLEFHLRVMEPDSARDTYDIIKEVLAFPERFMAAMGIKANMIKVRGVME